MTKVERKLTTILAADVVGFSKMMGQDEVGTLATLRACRSIIDGVIAEHRGRIFGSAGDSVLAEFSSPVEAVWCADKFQKFLAERNAQAATKQPMQFRVGINLGDVMIEGDNLYGDGVNVAARIESIAEAGGICVSSKVYEEVKRKLDIGFVEGGLRQLKNIEDPVAVFHIGSTADAARPQTASLPKAAQPRGSSGPPTIVIHPFKAVGGDETVKDLAIGLTEDVLGHLTKQKAIKVLAMPSGDAASSAGVADFVLEGSIRASGPQGRLAFSLVAVRENQQIWSERYDRGLDDVFKLQDEVSRNVAAMVRVKVKGKLFERLHVADNETLSVGDLLDKAAGYFVRSYGNNDKAEAALRHAIAKAPDSSMALAMLSMCLARQSDFSPKELPSPIEAEWAAFAFMSL